MYRQLKLKSPIIDNIVLKLLLHTYNFKSNLCIKNSIFYLYKKTAFLPSVILSIKITPVAVPPVMILY